MIVSNLLFFFFFFKQILCSGPFGLSGVETKREKLIHSLESLPLHEWRKYFSNKRCLSKEVSQPHCPAFSNNSSVPWQSFWTSSTRGVCLRSLYFTHRKQQFMHTSVSANPKRNDNKIFYLLFYKKNKRKPTN